MSVAILMSGGIDSSLCAVMAAEAGVEVVPVFVDYGQLAAEREFTTCRDLCLEHSFPEPVVVDLSGYGAVVPSGLTRRELDLNLDAFLPCRNLLMIVAAAGVAFSRGAASVAVGLLTEEAAIFPDQTMAFVRAAEAAVEAALGAKIAILTPLAAYSKATVVRLAEERGLRRTYSCHAGGENPCGVCVSCREIEAAQRLREAS